MGAGPAAADSRLLPAGSAIEIKNVVTGRIAKDKRQLEIGVPVHVNETIEATRDSRGEFELRDETKLVVASGARLVLDKFVYDPDATPGAVVLNLSKGAMRFVTGKSAKENYEIKTPVATIGVRGTVFDAFVSSDDELAVLLLEGAVEICTGQGTQRRCRIHDRVGEFVYVRRGTPIRQVPKYDGTFMKQRPIQAAFPFVGAPPSFNPAPTWTYDTFRPGGIFIPLPPRHPGGYDGPKYPPHGGGRPPGDGPKWPPGGGSRPPYDKGGTPPYGTTPPYGGNKGKVEIPQRHTDKGGRSTGASVGQINKVRDLKHLKKQHVQSYIERRQQAAQAVNRGSVLKSKVFSKPSYGSGPMVLRRNATPISKPSGQMFNVQRNAVRSFMSQPRLR